MNKVAHYLQEHLSGEITISPDVRKYFSTDASVFTVMPSIIAYPSDENDVRKAARFSWQLAERGRVVPITARGLGTDQGGAAIGPGIMMVFPAHMNKILELDTKTGVVTVEPGIVYGKLQQTLQTHNRFLPPFPASLEFSTVGGAVANNASGEKTIKYGSTRDFVRSLRIVLANGEIIDTYRLSKRELNKKLGLATFEGEIYRALDTLIEENREIIDEKSKINVSKNSAGYALSEVKRKDGSFDLTPLFVGSQGTLGIVTEIVLETEPYNPNATLMMAFFDDIQVAEQVVADLKDLKDSPSSIEVVDEKLLNFVQANNPNQLKGIIEPPFHKLVMLIEFDNTRDITQKRLAKKTAKILEKYQISFRQETESAKRNELWKIRRSAASVMSHTEGHAKALPIIEDGIVPTDKFQAYLEGVYDIFSRNNLQAAIWGHAGNANLHMHPFLDLSQVGDRQKVFKIIDEYYNMVIEMGGSTSGEHGDGRLRAPYLSTLYGGEIYELFNKVKNIFDPYGILNPGVKMGVTLDDIKPLLRSEYSLKHLHSHMARS